MKKTVDDKLNDILDVQATVVPTVNHAIAVTQPAEPEVQQNVEDDYVNITKNTLQLEVDNIIDEYLLLKSLDDIKSFIETRCTDSITKNKFSECLIDKYFIENKNNMNEIVELIKLLIKNQILLKTNLIKGLTLIYSDWNNKVIDYTKGNEKMKHLLGFFKSMNMTKGIEKILDNYKL